jgi:uncharacterized membrane protein
LCKVAESRFPGVTIVFTGTLDGEKRSAPEMAPGAELWVKYRQDWVKPLPGVAQMAGFA